MIECLGLTEVNLNLLDYAHLHLWNPSPLIGWNQLGWPSVAPTMSTSCRSLSTVCQRLHLLQLLVPVSMDRPLGTCTPSSISLVCPVILRRWLGPGVK